MLSVIAIVAAVVFSVCLWAIISLQRQVYEEARMIERLTEKLAAARGVDLGTAATTEPHKPLYSENTDEEGITHIADGTVLTKEPRPRIVVTDDQIQ